MNERMSLKPKALGLVVEEDLSIFILSKLNLVIIKSYKSRKAGCS